MKRQVPGLAETARDSRPEIPDGVFLVRVDGAQFRWHAHKPFYVLRLSAPCPRKSLRMSLYLHGCIAIHEIFASVLYNPNEFVKLLFVHNCGSVAIYI